MNPADRARYYELMADACGYHAASHEAMASAYALEGKAEFARDYTEFARNSWANEADYRRMAAEEKADFSERPF